MAVPRPLIVLELIPGSPGSSLPRPPLHLWSLFAIRIGSGSLAVHIRRWFASWWFVCYPHRLWFASHPRRRWFAWWCSVLLSTPAIVRLLSTLLTACLLSTWCTVQPPAEMEGEWAVCFGTPLLREPGCGGGQAERARVYNSSQVKVRRYPF